MKQTQYKIVLDHLRRYGSISSWQAFEEYGITRLSAVIFDLRGAGHNITTVDKTVTTRLGNKTTIAIYTLKHGTEQKQESLFSQDDMRHLV